MSLPWPNSKGLLIARRSSPMCALALLLAFERGPQQVDPAHRQVVVHARILEALSVFPGAPSGGTATRATRSSELPCGQTEDETADQEPGIPERQRPQPLFRAHVCLLARCVTQQQHLDGDAAHHQHSADAPAQGLDRPSGQAMRPWPGEKPSQQAADKAQHSHTPQAHHHEPPGAFLGQGPRRDTQAPAAAERPVEMKHSESDRPRTRDTPPPPRRCLVLWIFMHSEEHATAVAHSRRQR